MTPPEVRLAREKERELKELERATRTVFAFNLNIKADERDIFEFFSKAGEVRLLLLLFAASSCQLMSAHAVPVMGCVI